MTPLVAKQTIDKPNNGAKGKNKQGKIIYPNRNPTNMFIRFRNR
jgi:hypothetical protein